MLFTNEPVKAIAKIKQRIQSVLTHKHSHTIIKIVMNATRHPQARDPWNIQVYMEPMETDFDNDVHVRWKYNHDPDHAYGTDRSSLEESLRSDSMFFVGLCVLAVVLQERKKRSSLRVRASPHYTKGAAQSKAEKSRILSANLLKAYATSFAAQSSEW